MKAWHPWIVTPSALQPSQRLQSGYRCDKQTQRAHLPHSGPASSDTVLAYSPGPTDVPDSIKKLL